jgi:hypothetical protein
MSGLWVAVLAPLPFYAFLIWAAGWFLADTLRERRIARTAAAAAHAAARKPSPSVKDGNPEQKHGHKPTWLLTYRPGSASGPCCHTSTAHVN